jgi:hypothetical protein
MRELKVLFVTVLIFWMLRPAVSKGQAGNNGVGVSIESGFDRIYGADQRLVSGEYYHEPIFNTEKIEGHPFLIDGEWKDGYVIIDGVKFDNLRLRYDLTIQKVILQYNNISLAKYQICLKNEHIDSFMIDNRLFRKMSNKNARFCEVMSEGHIDYIIFRSKVRAVSNMSGSQLFEFNESIWQYLRVDRELISFRRSTIYKLFPLIKREIKQFKREKRLLIGKNYFIDRKKIVDYCNTLPVFQKLSK